MHTHTHTHTHSVPPFTPLPHAPQVLLTHTASSVLFASTCAHTPMWTHRIYQTYSPPPSYLAQTPAGQQVIQGPHLRCPSAPVSVFPCARTHTHTHVHTCTLHVQLAGGQAWQVASPRESPCVEGRAPKVCLVELWLPNRSATKSPVTPGNSCWHVLLEPRAVLLSPPFPFHSFGSLFLSCVFLAGFCFPP